MRLVARDARRRRARDHRHRAAGLGRDGLPRLPRVRRAAARPQPAEGWVHDPDPERDMRLNILRLHDDLERGTAAFTRRAGRPPATTPPGSYATAAGGTPILCARCHLSEALPGSGLAGHLAADAAPIHTRMAHGHRSADRPAPRRHRQPRAPAIAAIPARSRAACAAPWAAPSRPTARSRCSARAATAR